MFVYIYAMNAPVAFSAVRGGGGVARWQKFLANYLKWAVKISFGREKTIILSNFKIFISQTL